MKYMNVAKRFAAPVVVASSVAVSSLALADGTGIDYSAITGAVSFVTAGAAILVVLGLRAIIAISMRGGKSVLKSIGGGG